MFRAGQLRGGEGATGAFYPRSHLDKGPIATLSIKN